MNSGGIIVSTADNKCPVGAYKKYVAKLSPSCPFLWQHVVPQKVGTEHWYARKMGHNSTKDFMKKISSLCGLSQTFTNHSLRTSACTILGRKFSDIEVKSVSRHKSLTSLQIYKRVHHDKKVEMAASLSNALGFAAQQTTETMTSNDTPVGQPPQANNALTDNSVSTMDILDPDILEDFLKNFEEDVVPVCAPLVHEQKGSADVQSAAPEEGEQKKKNIWMKNVVNCSFTGCTINFN